MFVPCATLALAAAAASPVVPAYPAAFAVLPPVVAAPVDSTTALTEDQLAHYIAVQKALRPFWKAPEHATLLATAKSTRQHPLIETQTFSMKFPVFDYPALVKQDSALAAIFTSNKFTPAQFVSTHMAVNTALLELAMGSAPTTTTVEGKNIELVKKHRDELKAAGVAIAVQRGGGMGGGMGGGNGDLNP